LECEVCRDAESARLSDIIEIDAASNNSVEDIRDLREGAVYLPERCKYKVYIIDEVHMLSPSAFNALLKIMEEPPEFVKFILATTEIHKVPNTILSRCQRFDFKRILPEDISARLEYIAEHEDFTITDDASYLIAKLSDGGMRDAISLLDQASAFSNDITEEVVSNAVGIAGREYLFDALDYVVSRDIAKLFELVDSLYMQSKNLTVFCDSLISQLRNVMVIKVAPNQVSSLACMPSEVERLTRLAESLGLDTILYYMETLERCHQRLAKCTDKRTELEVSLSELCNYDSSAKSQASSTNVVSPQVSESMANLVGRINALESTLAVLKNDLQNSSYSKPTPTVDRPPKPTRVDSDSLPRILSSEERKPIPNEVWQKVLSEYNTVNPGVCAALTDSYAEICGSHVVITPKFKVFGAMFSQSETRVELAVIINRVLGGRYSLAQSNLEWEDPNVNHGNSTQANGSYSFGNLIARANDNGIPTKQVD
jgi:DNA polymerase-3 subunit gamma/tau